MITEYTSTASTELSPCSGCGGWRFGCGSPKTFPTSLAFVVNQAASCPGVPGNVVSGVMTLSNARVTCGDLATVTCTPADGITPVWPAFCDCSYTWSIDPADIPLCGPYLQSVSMACRPAAEQGYADGPPAGCAHVGRTAKKIWVITVVWARTDGVPPVAPECPISVGHPTPRHAVQRSDDCTAWDCVDGAGPHVCNPDCPACTCPETWYAAECAAGAICCGTTACFQWFTTDELPCTRCWHATAASAEDPSCLCSQFKTGREYRYIVTDCADPDDILGCNPVACPPDDKNTGDFALDYGCGNVAGDKIHVGCTMEGVMARLAARHVAKLTDDEVDAALASQLALGV